MPETRRLDLLNDLLKTAERNFDDTVKFAALVADNAQKTSGLAGLFLAAAFGFVKPEPLATLREQYGAVALGFLYLALALFVTAVLLCLRAMWFKDIPTIGLSRSNHRKCRRSSLYISLPPISTTK